MTTVTIRSDIEVKLIDSMASDLAVTRAAQVSVKGENNPDTDTPRLINYLMESRHGSPFEHTAMTFFVKAPIFVFREWHRHRISSINEMSGRYTKLYPEFYAPDEMRKLVNVGTSARPEFAPGDSQQQVMVQDFITETAQFAWDRYEAMIDAGVANEIARAVLPVTTYSQMYWTVNARSLMNFVSLRAAEMAQREIRRYAEAVEKLFAEQMPITHAAFVANERTAP